MTFSKLDNEKLTRVGAGTPMGETMRRYWLPALLCEELPEPDCPPVRVRLLGEDLLAFRDTSGQVGGCWKSSVPTGARRSFWAATKKADCVASTTAGSSTSAATA